jgi:hypothetical protein
MIQLARIRNFLKNLDMPEIYKYTGILLGAVALILGLILWNYYSGVQTLQKRLIAVNKQRTETRQLLEKNEQVLQQQAHVDAVLDRDKNFKIKEYFMAIVQKLGLSSLISKDADISANTLVNDYTEIKLDVGLSGMNMQQLVDLLYNIEQNERVYTKELKITKSLRSATIDVSLVIATFEANPQTT